MNAKHTVHRTRVLRRAIAGGAIVLLVVAVAYGGWRVYDDVRQRPYRQLEANLSAVRIAVERFHVDSFTGYPASLKEVVAAGYLEELPENPFRPGEPMPTLTVGDAATPGGVMYLPWRWIVGTWDREDNVHPPEIVSLQLAPGDQIRNYGEFVSMLDVVDEYVLLSFRERASPPGQRVESLWRVMASRTSSSKGVVGLEPPPIEWQYVHQLLCSHPDLTSGDGPIGLIDSGAKK